MIDLQTIITHRPLGLPKSMAESRLLNLIVEFPRPKPVAELPLLCGQSVACS